MEWIIAAGIGGKMGYRIFDAFKELEYIDWHKVKQTKNINEGDIVYIYINKPIQKIMFKTRCVKSSVPIGERINDREYYNDPNECKKTFRVL